MKCASWLPANFKGSLRKWRNHQDRLRTGLYLFVVFLSQNSDSALPFSLSMRVVYLLSDGVSIHGCTQWHDNNFITFYRSQTGFIDFPRRKIGMMQIRDYLGNARPSFFIHFLAMWIVVACLVCHLRTTLAIDSVLLPIPKLVFFHEISN